MLSPTVRPRSVVQSTAGSKLGTARSSRSTNRNPSESHRTTRLVSAAPFDPTIEQAELAALQAAIVFPPSNGLDDVKPPTAPSSDESTQSNNQSINQSVSTPRLRFETFHSKLDYRFDGDRTMDTDAMIAKRRRLKQDANIQTWINVFWRTFHHKSLSVGQSNDPGSSSESESSDDEEKVEEKEETSLIVNDPFAAPTDQSNNQSNNQTIKPEAPLITMNQSKARFSLGGSISRSQYLLVHKLWFKALHKLYDRSDAHIQAIKDWTRDSWLSMRSDSLDHAAFTDALFELIDLWTLTVDPQEYVHFLATLYHRVTRVKTWLNDEGAILTKYVWRRTKYVKPSAVYRPYQYNKYKNVAWKAATEVIHHFYSDSDSEFDEEEDDGVDDVIIKDLTQLSDEFESSEEEEESDYSLSDSDGSVTPSEHRHGSSRSQRTNGGRHSINQSISQSVSLTGGDKPSLPPLLIDANAVIRSLPDVDIEPPQSPYLDPPAVIPQTPYDQSPRFEHDNDIDESDNESDIDRFIEETDLLSRADQKSKYKLETAMDVLNQRRQDRMLKMLSKFTKLLDKQHVPLRRSNSVLVFDGHGGLSHDVDQRFKTVNQTVVASPSRFTPSRRSFDDSDVDGLVDAEDDPRYQAIKHTINESIKRGSHHRRQTCPFDVASFSCLPPRWSIESHRPNLTARSTSSHLSRKEPSLDSSDDEDYDDQSRAMSAVSTAAFASGEQSVSRPATVDMQQDDFEAYMKSLQTDMAPQRPQQSYEELPDLPSENQSIEPSPESTTSDLPPHPDDPHHMMQQMPLTPMTEDDHPPSTAINQTANGSPFQHNRGLAIGPPSPVFSHSQRLVSPLSRPAKKSKRIPSDNPSKVSSPVLVDHTISLPNNIEETPSESAVEQSDLYDQPDPEPQLHLHASSTDEPKPVAPPTKPKRRSSRARSPEPSKSDLNPASIRDEALAAEYDEDVHSRIGLKSSHMGIMREIDEDDAIPPPTADESRSNTGHVRKLSGDGDDGGISLSMRLAAAQAERAKAVAARDRLANEAPRHKEDDATRKKREEERKHAEEEAAMQAIKAEQELFTLLHEAEEQRRVEAQLKAQKREIAKKEKDARRKLRGDVDPDHSAEHEDRRPRESQSNNEHHPDVCKKKDISASGAVRDAAAARRRAEKNEEEQARLDAIKERQAAEAAKAEAARAKAEKHVLKAKSKPKRDEQLGQPLPPLAEDDEGGVKIRPDFLKARRHDDDPEPEKEESSNESTERSSEESTERSNLSSTAESTARSSIQSSPVHQTVDQPTAEPSPVKHAKPAKGKVAHSNTSTPSKPPRHVSKGKVTDENQTASQLNQPSSHPVIKKKVKKHHSSDDESDNEQESDADRLIRLEEEKKFGFGRDWSLEEKRAFREKELIAEKAAQKVALAKTGELGLVEMRWASTRDKIKHDEDRADLLAEQQRQMEELEKQKLLDHEKKIAEKEREMIEREAAKIRKAELEEANKRLAVEKREARMNQAADHAANKQSKDHSTAQSTERSTRRARGHERRQPKQMIEAEDRPSNSSGSTSSPQLVSRSTDARAMNAGTIVKRSEVNRTVKVVESVHSTINSDANRAADAAADRKRELIAKRREEAQKRVADQQRLREMRAEELREAAAQHAASQKKPPQHFLTADEVRQRQKMQTPEQRESTADRNSATEKAPFFRPVPARRAMHATEPAPVLVAAEDEQGRLVEAQIDPRDNEIKYWVKATLEEQEPSLISHRAPLTHRDQSTNILADSEESVKADLAALRQPAQRGWGLTLAKETEPSVVESLTIPLNISQDQEAHDWQLASARGLVASQIDIPIEIPTIDETPVEPPLSARPMHVPVAKVERPRDEPFVMETRVEAMPHRVAAHVAHAAPAAAPRSRIIEPEIEEPTYPAEGMEVPFTRTVKQIEMPKHVVDMQLAEAAQRKADLDEQARTALDHTINQSEATRNEANARRAQYMADFMEHTRLRNAAKVKRKNDIDEQSILQYIEMREQMERSIKDWQLRKNELFYASEEARRDRAIRKLERIEASRQRQEERAYQAEQLIATRRQIMHAKEERRRRRVAEREEFLHAKQQLNKQREISATEKRRMEEEFEAEQRRVNEQVRAQHEHQQHEQWKLREAARIEETERLKRAAREYREKIARDKELARIAELDRIERERKESAKASVMAVLHEMQASAAAEEETQRVIEQEKQRKEQEAEQERDTAIRTSRASVMHELLDFHAARAARQAAINLHMRRQQLEFEQRRKEEVVIMRVSRQRLNQGITHIAKPVNRTIQNDDIGVDPTPFITQHGATYQSVDQPAMNSNNHPIDMSKSHPLSSPLDDQSNDQSNNVLLMAKRAMAQYLTQQHFNQTSNQPNQSVYNVTDQSTPVEEESKVELVILGDQTDRPRSVDQPVEFQDNIIDQFSTEKSFSQMSDKSIDRAIARYESPLKPRRRLDPQLAKISSNSLNTSSRKLQHELLVSGHHSHQLVDSLGEQSNRQSPSPHVSAASKRTQPHKQPVKHSVVQQSSNPSHLWGNNEEQFSLVGQKQRAFIRNAKTVMLPSITQPVQQTNHQVKQSSKPATRSSHRSLPALPSSARSSPRSADQSIDSAELIVSSKPSSAMQSDSYSGAQLPPLVATPFLVDESSHAHPSVDPAGTETKDLEGVTQSEQSVVDQPDVASVTIEQPIDQPVNQSADPSSVDQSNDKSHILTSGTTENLPVISEDDESTDTFDSTSSLTTAVGIVS